MGDYDPRAALSTADTSPNIPSLPQLETDNDEYDFDAGLVSLSLTVAETRMLSTRSSNMSRSLLFTRSNMLDNKVVMPSIWVPWLALYLNRTSVQ